MILAGFASRNNYAMLGGLRATAQMISYEIALGISVVGVVTGRAVIEAAEASILFSHPALRGTAEDQLPMLAAGRVRS